MIELDRLLVENPDFVKIYVMALKNPDLITEEDSLRYLAFEHIYYDSWETLWYYYNEGLWIKMHGIAGTAGLLQIQDKDL